MKTYRLHVTGRVQGVWYRQNTVNRLQPLGYLGYVKNLPDGSVEVVVNLEDASGLETLIKYLYEGSPMSKVDDVTCKEIDCIEFDDFGKRY